MTRDQARDKVKKLLRLGKSSNMHEAAAAMRQAQALMRQHAIDEQELRETQPDDTVEVTTSGRRGASPPVYAVGLVHGICAAFGVDAIAGGTLQSWRFHFFGPAWRTQLAEYAFTVLLRQLERDRRKHLNRVRLAKNRAARGDVFGVGWAHGVSKVLSAWDLSEEDRERTNALIARKYPAAKVQTFDVRESRASKCVAFNDHAMGHALGSKARLDRGVGLWQKAIA